MDQPVEDTKSKREPTELVVVIEKQGQTSFYGKNGKVVKSILEAKTFSRIQRAQDVLDSMSGALDLSPLDSDVVLYVVDFKRYTRIEKKVA